MVAIAAKNLLIVSHAPIMHGMHACLCPPLPALISAHIPSPLDAAQQELASKRLAADQRNFEAVTALLLEPTWHQWAADTAAVAAELPAALEAPLAQGQALLVTFERWLLQLKALRRMIIFGFPSDARSLQQVGAVGQVGPPLLQTLQQFAAVRAGRAAEAARNQVQAMLDRALLKLLKTLRQVQEAHPW